MSALVYLTIGAGFGAIVGMLMMAVVRINQPIREQEDRADLAEAINRVSQ